MQEYIPLFVQAEFPFAVIIINNEIFGFEELASIHRTPYRAYYFLHQLYHNEYTKSIFPKELHNFFENQNSLNLEPFIVGEWEDVIYPMYCYALEASMEIKRGEHYPITLHNFVYNGEKLDYELKLSISDAFYLFMNILANSRCGLINDFYNRYPSKKNEISFLQDKFKQREISEIHLPIIDDLFYAYLELLEKQLKKDEVTPAYLLSLSGGMIVPTLAKLHPVLDFQSTINYINQLQDYLKSVSLTQIQEIIYTTLFYNIYSHTNREGYLRYFKTTTGLPYWEMDKSIKKKFPTDYETADE
ncbi:MAG: hypothetical protein FK733_08160 [Asgard group archaeon]|nr:hypothetical protein [Asgard group archaeon]